MKNTGLMMLSMVLLSGCLPQPTDEDEICISRDRYADQLYGFWLGECIANWTGLVTEMDKIGNIGEIKTGEFYTRDDWGRPDQPNIWSGDQPSDLSPVIEFVLRDSLEIWGSDDDTDIEYMYQYLLYTQQVSMLSPAQIREGWLRHIRNEEENYLWVSNQRAFDLMKEGMLPPQTGNPANNEWSEMIDAQLTTEIFGLLAPTRPEVARNLARLPIQTTARNEAEFISQFYVTMHALAAIPHDSLSMKDRIIGMARESRRILPEDSYPAAMFDVVFRMYQSGIPWEQCRDSVYVRYQVESQDGYDISSRNLYCNGCFAAGINFAASLVSLFYGEGDLKETIRIGTLCGWDSDNPTATWGGLIGFMIGKKGVEDVFGSNLSHRYHIHRTRQNFPNDGMDTFDNMALQGIEIIDRVVIEQLSGRIDEEANCWVIPIILE